MNTLSEARAEANAAERLVCLLAFEIAKLNKFLGEVSVLDQTGGLRTRPNPYQHIAGEAFTSSAPINQVAPDRPHDGRLSRLRSGHHGSAGVRHPLTDTETLPPSRCQREAVRQHKPRNGLASPSAGE